ncbi:NPCBM/NEW2 domain-containing protein [Saccharicrinis sp. FJH2]|uniref:NPCBM/NEW2 domain-containing protein n=1 Tax=Saccharicrinis sp. FJH65 TaxID=3344659 RepID=UPI0035F265A4
MKTLKLIILLVLISPFTFAQTGKELPFQKWAVTPPMGWNSWDCFGPSVVESEVKANADYMAENLKDYGWEYIVVDIRWYVDNQTSGSYNSFDNSTFIYDEYGRYMPSPTRFPSAANGAGFKPLADYIHAKGLKFGIHIMRGVPRKAITNSLPIKGYESKTAADIYNTNTLCTWLQDNYTVDATKDGAQEYYNSIFELYASWGVDFVKVDDLSRPYHSDEIEMIRNAIDNSGRPMVLSMSPGATPLDEHDHAKNHANMWRTVDDFWDNWSQLNYSFTKCAEWAPYISPGGWPDADMLPLGKFIRGERATNRYTNFTEPEQYTLMTLWSIFRSPLMFGGNLPDNQSFTDSLITNKEVLGMHKLSVNNKEWYKENEVVSWTADDPVTGDKFVALFNSGGDGFVSTKDLLYRSGTISTLTDGYGVNIDISIPAGSKELYLIVTDAGDGYDCDHADWISPYIYFDNGDSALLSDMDWEYASAGWNSVQKNKSISGGTLNVKGTTYAKGLGTHPQSIVLYSIPENTVGFKAFAGLDIGGTSQACGSTVEFMIANQDPTVREVNVHTALANSGRISRTIGREGDTLTADITGAEKLYLVVTDAGDNFNYDHGDWINPAIYMENGDSLLLTSLNWVSATSGWASVRKNLSLDGNTLKVNGKSYTNGFGVNSYSIIEFNLPTGYTTFKTFCGFDDEVLNAPDGVTIEFLVYTQDPSVKDSLSIPLNLVDLGFNGSCSIRDMWAKEDLGTYSGSEFAPSMATHGAGLYRVSAIGRSADVEANLSASAAEIMEDENLTLTVDVSKTAETTDTISGWVQIYQNDSLIANIELNASGVAEYSTVLLTEGNYTFTANYGGNTLFIPSVTNPVSVTVTKNHTALSGETITLKLWITSMGGLNYLNGLHQGDKVVVYNINGRKLDEFTASSDVEKISAKGTVLIEVIAKGSIKQLKAVL